MSSSGDRSLSSLDRTFAAGLAWTASAKWLTQLITWGSVLIVTRLLSPRDYGVGEIAGLFTMLANMLAEFGIGTAVLHMPELSRRALAQLNVFSCLLGVAVFTVANLAVPAIAAFFHSSDLLVFIVDNLTLVITGFQSVPMGMLQRDLDYKRLSLAEAAMVLVQAAVTVTMAFRGFGYWSLVVGVIAGKTVGAFLVCWWKPVGFAWPRLSELKAPLNLGRQSAVSRIAWALYTQADIIVVGRFLGEATLGTYRMASTLAYAPSEKVGALLMRAAGPMFANVKDDKAVVRRYYLLLTEILGLTIMPLMFGLAMTATAAVTVVFRKEWIAAAGPLRWLALYMIVRSLSVLTEQVLTSQLRTAFLMKASILTLCIMPVAFSFAAYWYGASGVASIWVLLAPLTVLPLIVVLLREIHLPFGEYMNALLPSSAGSIVMCSGLAVFQRLVPSSVLPVGAYLTVEILIGALLYILTVWLGFGKRLERYTRFISNLRRPQAAPAAV